MILVDKSHFINRKKSIWGVCLNFFVVSTAIFNWLVCVVTYLLSALLTMPSILDLWYCKVFAHILLQDFDEDGYFNDISIAVAPAVQFPMYPPVESTPESRYSGSAVYFEPLPDLSTRRRNQEVTTNSLRLRPKVSQVGFDRMGSEDWDEGEGEWPYFDRSRELAKLERLVSKLTFRILTYFCVFLGISYRMLQSRMLEFHVVYIFVWMCAL